jgi:hypothetical protein
VKIPPAALKFRIVFLAPYDKDAMSVLAGCLIIDRMLRGTGPGSCELCGKRPATRKAKFTAQSLQSVSMMPFDEEAMVETNFEKRLCEECLAALQKAKNVSNLVFERL